MRLDVLIWRAFRFAVRSHVRAPGPAAALVLTVALGVGGNAALFSFIGGFAARTGQATDPEAVLAFGRTALLLTVACGLVLVLACASAAGLLLARSTARVRDVALRIAIGADRRAIAVLQIADVTTVVLAGAVLGALAAWWIAQAFPLLFFAEDAEQLAMQPSVRWLVWSTAASVVTLLAAGLLPLLTASQRDPFLVLRREGPGMSPATVRWRARLVTAQAAGCALLVMLAGVIRADFDRSIRSARGAAVADLTVVKVRVNPATAFADEDLGRQYLQDVQKAATSTVGATVSAWMSTLPGARSGPTAFVAEDRVARTREIRLDAQTFDPDALPPAGLVPVKGRGFTGRDDRGGCRTAILNQTAADQYFNGDPVGAAIEDANGQVVQIVGVLADDPSFKGRPILFFHANQLVLPAAEIAAAYFAAPLDVPRRPASLAVVGASPSYFDLMADPVVQGRGFESRDTAIACQVAVISEAAARDLFGGRAIGATLIDHRGARIEIVGVVKSAALGPSERAGAPWLLRPDAQLYSPMNALVVRMPLAIGAERRLNAAVRAVPGGTPMGPAMPLREYLMMSALAPERIASALMAVCAVLAIALSIAGIHGAMSDYVDRRRRELAVRLAMGARAVNLIAGVVRQGVRLTLRGTMIGLVLAAPAIPVLGVAIGPATLPAATAVIAALVVMFAMVAISCAVPAWRAIAIDPKALLQSE
jgi:hypothetical protein